MGPSGQSWPQRVPKTRPRRCRVPQNNTFWIRMAGPGAVKKKKSINLIFLFQCITTAICSMAVYVSIAVLGAALFWVNKTFIMANSHTLLPHTYRFSSTYEEDSLPPKPTGQVRSDSLSSCELIQSSSLDSSSYHPKSTGQVRSDSFKHHPNQPHARLTSANMTLHPAPIQLL